MRLYQLSVKVVVLAMLFGAISGCMATDLFMRRGRDLRDCFEASVGYCRIHAGPPAPYGRIAVTDFVVVSAGVSATRRFGWHGRYAGELGEWDEYTRGAPLVGTTVALKKGDKSHREVNTFGPCITYREYSGDLMPGPRGKIAEKFWIGVSATLFVPSFRAGFNPAEFADFITGCAGWDMLKDDDWAPKEGKEGSASEDTDSVVTENYGSLHDAVKEGDALAVRRFLVLRADVNAKDKHGFAPLHWAKDRAVAQLLITIGADVNAKDKQSRTPLHWAAIRGRKEVAELLITSEADGSVKDKHGWAPLHWAAWSGHTEVAELLIARGADVTVKNEKGETPLALAVKEAHSDVANILRKHGAKE